MSATYVRISGCEFQTFLQNLVPDAEHAPGAPGSEEAWNLPLPHDDLTIRVFSTVDGGRSRDCGDDAIRCVLWHHGVDAPVGGRRKTLRIGPSKSNPEGWRANLRDKIEDLYASWRDEYNGLCPECGKGAMVLREPGPSDDWLAFLACTEYNDGFGCEHTERP